MAAVTDCDLMSPAVTWTAHFVSSPVHGSFIPVVFPHFYISGGWVVPLAKCVVPMWVF